LKIPCLALAGVLDLPRGDENFVTAVAALTDITTLQRAKANPSMALSRLARLYARLMTE
jgi:hypothetical protein